MRREPGIAVACVAVALAAWWWLGSATQPVASASASTAARAPVLLPTTAATRALEVHVAAPASSSASAAPSLAASGGDAVPGSVSAAVADPGADEAPPPYPWAEAPPQDSRRGLARGRATFWLEDEPLLDVLRLFEQWGLPPVEVTPAARELIGDARVHLRLRGISAYSMLTLALAASDASLGVVWYPDRVLVCVCGEEVAQGPPLAPKTVDERIQELAHLAEDGELSDPRWREDALRALDTPVTATFAETPLAEVMNNLGHLTGARFRVVPTVEAEETTVSLQVTDARLRDVLDTILRPDLGWCLNEPGIEIGAVTGESREGEEGRVPSGPALRDRLVDLDLRGVTLRELGQALERQGVPVLVAREAWASAGTLSLIVRDLPLGAVLQAGWLKAHLQITWDPRDENREVLLIRGQLAAVTDDLLDGPMPRFSGVAEAIARERAELALALTRRADQRARAGPLVLRSTLELRAQFEPWPLFDLEREVDTKATRLRDLLTWVQLIESAPVRTRELEQALAAAIAARDAARESHVALLHAQRARELEDDLDRARMDLETLRSVEAGAGPPE